MKNNSKSIVKNPWQNIDWHNTAASCDNNILCQVTTPRLFLDELPEPFHGNPDAPVYLLLANPFGNGSLAFNGNQILLSKLNNTYSLKAKVIMWLESPETIVDTNGKSHNGYAWWKQKLQILQKDLGKIPNIFAIEYFPYHSEHSFQYPNLPSYKFSDQLICDAMKKGKTIIIARCWSQWQVRIPTLSSYNNLLFLKNPQAPYITPKNLVKQANWASFLKQF